MPPTRRSSSSSLGMSCPPPAHEPLPPHPGLHCARARTPHPVVHLPLLHHEGGTVLMNRKEVWEACIDAIEHRFLRTEFEPGEFEIHHNSAVGSITIIDRTTN